MPRRLARAEEVAQEIRVTVGSSFMNLERQSLKGHFSELYGAYAPGQQAQQSDGLGQPVAAPGQSVQYMESTGSPWQPLGSRCSM